MNIKENFEKIMNESQVMALATCLDNQSDVRLVTFIYKDKKIYISTLLGSQKTKEFENSKVSMTTLLTSNGVIRIREGKVKRADYTAEELKEEFMKKAPQFEKSLEKFKEKFVIYEIKFDKAEMTTKQGLQKITIDEI